MEVRPYGFGEGVIRRVPDQQVPEAEAVLARDLSALRADELLAHEAGQLRRHLFPVWRHRDDGTAVEGLALDGAPLEDLALRVVELVEPGCEERAQRGRHLDLVGLARHGQHLGQKQRVAT